MTTVQYTSAPRAGRRFEPTHERHLYDQAIAACDALPGRQRGVLGIREMTGPVGIPDITALVADLSRLRLRLASEIRPILSQLDAAIVAGAAVNRPRSPTTLARGLGWPTETITRRLPYLIQARALIPAHENSYLRHPALGPIGRLYAIEAKVSNRHAAIQQVRAYSAWADGYVLVMGPLGQRPLELLLEDVDTDGGGLIVDGRWLRRPVMKVHSVARRFWAAEHFVAAARDFGYQPSVAP